VRILTTRLSFLLGDSGVRKRPHKSDTDIPNVFNEYLLSKAVSTHDVLDAWEPAVDDSGMPEIEIIQIAGWGIDTVRGMHYDDCDVLFCSQNFSNLGRELLFTEDGDGTVVSPSTVGMNHVDDSLYQNFYVDLNEQNTILRINRKHSDILEVEDLQVLWRDIIEDSLGENILPKFIYSNKPESKHKNRKLCLRVKSPISIDEHDSIGAHIGLVSYIGPGIQYVVEQIPNSYYYEIGEKKYVEFDTQDEYIISIQGLVRGSFTLILEEVFKGEIINTKSFIDIPVSPNTKGSFTVQTVDSVSELILDIDGDGIDNLTVGASEKPDPLVSLTALKSVVGTLDVYRGIKNQLLNK